MCMYLFERLATPDVARVGMVGLLVFVLGDASASLPSSSPSSVDGGFSPSDVT